MKTITYGGQTVEITEEQWQKVKEVIEPQGEEDDGFYLSGGGRCYAHNVNGDIDGIDGEAPISNYLNIIIGDSFEAFKGAEAADFKLIEHRAEVYAKCEAIYRKHRPKGWKRKQGEAAVVQVIGSDGHYGRWGTEGVCHFPFPYSDKGCDANEAFIAECGDLLKQYFELR